MKKETKYYFPSFQEFEKNARLGNMVPVYREFISDTLTPVSAFSCMENFSYGFLLESVIGQEKVARYSFVGTEPFIVFKSYGENITVQKKSETHSYCGNPWDILKEILNRYKEVKRKELPRFTGGAVGYIGYDAVRFIEKLPEYPKPPSLFPDFNLAFYNTTVIFDHIRKTIIVCSLADLQEHSATKAYTLAKEKIDSMIDLLSIPRMPNIKDIYLNRENVESFTSNFTKEQFEEAVRKSKEYIYAGDIFQVVLSQRLELETNKKPFDIYRILRVINPSPYMFYLKMEDEKLIGSSPEVMVRLEEGKVTLRPIAGTRPRGATEEEDKTLANDLLNDPKERAEHIMLVDLGRNDIGRIAEYGTVKVDEQMIIEKYSHVMHIVSNISGKVAKGKDAIDVLKATLPAGTVSGAPKVRAMEIIEELEPTRRGPYAGAVGYFDFSGNMDTCITIRTIMMKGKRAMIQAGAGIVADSIPEKEYIETLNKAKALMRAIELA